MLNGIDSRRYKRLYYISMLHIGEEDGIHEWKGTGFG